MIPYRAVGPASPHTDPYGIRVFAAIGRVLPGSWCIRGTVAHEGDPCKHCNTPHDDVPAGPCSALGPVDAGPWP